LLSALQKFEFLENIGIAVSMTNEHATCGTKNFKLTPGGELRTVLVFACKPRKKSRH